MARNPRLLSGITGLVLLVSASAACALGTAAGTRVQNSVVVTFQINGNPETVHTERASHTFIVSEIIRSNVSSLNPEGVATPTPARDITMSFQLTNTGNGEEAFLLSPQTGSGDFPADITRMWLESNGQPGLQADDTPYNPAVGVKLEADDGAIIYVTANIPADLDDQARGNVVLTATSATTGANGLSMGEALADGGDGGIEAVVAQNNASHDDSGDFIVSGIRLGVEKEIIAVNDPYQGNLVMPGAEITYQITIKAEGRGVAKDLKINDPTPASMAYKPNTLLFNGERLTDQSDDDAAYFDAEADLVWFMPGTITAPLTQKYTVTYVVD